MEPPIPTPRITRINGQFSDSGSELATDKIKSTSPSVLLHEERSGMIQVSAEVHSTVSTGNNSERQDEKQRTEKKKKKVKRKGTFTLKDKKKSTEKKEDTVLIMASESKPNSVPGTTLNRKGSGTETISDSDSGRIKLIPLRVLSARRRVPTGSATETLSEDSEQVSPELPSRLPPVPPRRKSVPSPKVQIDENQPTSPANIPTNDSNSALSPPPVPAPRRSIRKSPEQIGSPYCTSSSLEYKDPDALPSRLRKVKKKRKLKDNKENNDLEESVVNRSTESIPNQVSTAATPTREVENNKEEMACLTVHRCEPLHLKHFNRRLFVRVHVIDLTTGKYKKSALGKMDVPALSTSPFDYAEHRLAMPTWEEDLIFLEPISHIVAKDTILIMEIVDSQKDDVIAWAFLKPVAANGAQNTGKTLRLQLHKPGKSCRDTSLPKGYQWWLQSKHSFCSSTLYITLNGVPSDFIIKPSTHEEINGQETEISNENEVKIFNSEKTMKKEDSDVDDVVWSRLPSLSCKLPNAFEVTLDTGTTGSMAVAYSHSGLHLACQVGDNLCIFKYRGKNMMTLAGHQGLIYCLKWSEDDRYLLSSSADSTACVWDIENRRPTPLQVLSHPNYVYSCCWLDESNNLIVTACFDKYIRLWKLGSRTPLQLLLKHSAPINSVAILESGILISGDNVGTIIAWKLNSAGLLDFEKEFQLREIKGKIINKLVVHPGGKRMLVHTRDSVLRMLDMNTGTIVQWFRGGLNTRFRCDSCFCGCGSRVFATCEDGSTCCWDAHTGQMIAIYTRLQLYNGAASIDFHPRDHYLAVASNSAIGSGCLSIIKYDRSSNGKEVGIILIDISQTDVASSCLSLNSSLSGSRSTPSLIKESLHSSPVQHPLEEHSKSKRKEFGIFKALLGRKKIKKSEPNNGYQSTQAGAVLQKKNKLATSSISLSDHGTRDDRLTDIIKRMDKILIAISSTKPH